MSIEALIDVPQWYAVHTHPKQESRAESNLQAWKVETFAPRLKEQRYSNGMLVRSVKFLFPQYIFARFRVNELLHKVNFTRGVDCVVSFSSSPTPVDDQIIEVIKRKMDEDGYVNLGEKFKAGDVVMIKDGPLKNFQGIFEREVNHTDRVMLLMTAINYQSHIIIERGRVRKVSGTRASLGD